MADLDSATRAKLRLVYPDLAVRVRRVYEDMRRIHGVAVRTTDGLRTFKQQEDRYAEGRTAPGKIVTNAPAGDSFHSYGLAVDSCFVGSDPYLERNDRGEMYWIAFGKIAQAHGLMWGGSWSRFLDKPHVQISYGLSLLEVKDLYLHGQLWAVWAKCDQIRGLKIGGEWYGPQASSKILGQPPRGALC